MWLWVNRIGDEPMNSVREVVGDLQGAVVVGIDGRPQGVSALRFAAEEARLRGLPLAVVHGWHITTAKMPPTAEPGYVPPLADFERSVANRLGAQVRDALGPEPGLEVQLLPVYCTPVAALVSASRTASMVVMRTRGRGTLLGLILGSVTERVLHQAHCPVVIVH